MLDKSFFVGIFLRLIPIYFEKKTYEAGCSHSGLIDKYIDFGNFCESIPNVSNLGTTFLHKVSYRIFQCACQKWLSLLFTFGHILPFSPKFQLFWFFDFMWIKHKCEKTCLTFFSNYIDIRLNNILAKNILSNIIFLSVIGNQNSWNFG